MIYFNHQEKGEKTMMPIEVEAQLFINNGWSSEDEVELITEYHFEPEHAHELSEAMRKIEQGD